MAIPAVTKSMTTVIIDIFMNPSDLGYSIISL